MRRHLSLLATPALTAALTFGLLVACDPVATGPDYSYGTERVARCIETSCDRLDLDGASLENYAQLASLTHVTALMLSYTDFSDLGDIAAMAQLQELHIGETGLRDLSGLAAFPNLRLLHVQRLTPESWAPLTRLSHLQELAIGDYEMDDFSIIAQLPQLQRLRIIGAAPEASLSALGRHPGLRVVDLTDADFSDLSPLLRLPKLREIALSEYQAETHADIISALRARGVTISIAPTMIVC